MEYHPNLLAVRIKFSFGNIILVNHNPTRVNLIESGNQFHQRTFTGTTQSHNADKLPSLKFSTNIIELINIGTWKTKGEIFDFDMSLNQRHGDVVDVIFIYFLGSIEDITQAFEG